MKILHFIGAVVAGFVAGVLVIALIEGISSMIYKMPEGLDTKDLEAMADWVSTLPVGAFLFVLSAWGCGCFVGAFVARRIAPQRSAKPGLIVWALLTIATISNLIMIPHPIWVSVVAVPDCLVFGLLGLVVAAPGTYTVQCNRTIKAPIETVFATLAKIDEFSQAIPAIQKVEFLTDTHYGVGTRFRETRLVNGREAAATLEVTELVENKLLRIVSDEGGTVWDTIFRVQKSGEQVEMEMKMDARPYKFAARIITPMIFGMVSKFVRQDMDSVKLYCESAELQD